VAGFIGYPDRQVLGVLDDDASVGRARAALHAAGIDDRDVEVLSGASDATRFDATGSQHGLLARLRRVMQFSLMDQLPAMAWYEAALREDRRVIAVRTRDRRKTLAAVGALKSAGGHFINHFGRMATEEFARWRGPEPPISDVMKH
jgi:hypothetical protein